MSPEVNLLNLAPAEQGAVTCSGAGRGTVNLSQNDPCHSEGATRLRNLDPGPLKSHELVLQLYHSQWRKDHVQKRFRPLADFTLSNAEGFGVTF